MAVAGGAVAGARFRFTNEYFMPGEKAKILCIFRGYRSELLMQATCLRLAIYRPAYQHLARLVSMKYVILGLACEDTWVEVISMGRIACVGSRALNHYQLEHCLSIGRYLAMKRFTISTGNALGADQAFARGGNQVNPEMVELHLPWEGYEASTIMQGNMVALDGDDAEFTATAKICHPAWDKLKRGGRALMTRNVGIIRGASQVVAFPGETGGTRHSIRVAQHLGIPVVDLSDLSSLRRVIAVMAAL